MKQTIIKKLSVKDLIKAYTEQEILDILNSIESDDRIFKILKTVIVAVSVKERDEVNKVLAGIRLKLRLQGAKSFSKQEKLLLNSLRATANLERFIL